MTRACRICTQDDGPCAAHEPDNDGYNQSERDDAAEDAATRAMDAMW